uniref:Protein kinase domain-containing protein n=1 Tax=Fagus sylvatica TaxID=28930 RepID=A0A2N9FF35_FAGSY
MKREAEASDFGDGETWVRGPLIGKGGFGSVFLATSKKPNSRFQCFPSVMAVKSAEVSISASLQKEKEVHNNVQGCPNVIHCFGEDITFSAQQNGEMAYNLLLEYASGGTLSDLINNSGLLPESDVKRYTKSILRGLTHIHNCGYVHCDLKPDNVLLVPNSSGIFVAKIGDLGLAKRSELRKKMRLDLRDYLRGTALYMAPETVIENVQDPPSDIWALGCVVCEMLTGKSPWDSVEELHTKDLLHLIEHELPKIPTRISTQARDFLKACLVRKPMFRFTAEMLMVHPFLAGVDEPCYDEELLPAVPSSSWSETDSELSGSSFSDDWSSQSDDDSASCSCSEDVEDFEVGFVVSTDNEVSVVGQKRKMVTIDNNHKLRTAAAAQASLKFPASTIPIGA